MNSRFLLISLNVYKYKPLQLELQRLANELRIAPYKSPIFRQEQANRIRLNISCFLLLTRVAFKEILKKRGIEVNFCWKKSSGATPMEIDYDSLFCFVDNFCLGFEPWYKK